MLLERKIYRGSKDNIKRKGVDMEENILNINADTDARTISEIFERDSRRYSRALSEEMEAKLG